MLKFMTMRAFITNFKFKYIVESLTFHCVYVSFKILKGVINKKK